MYRETPFGPQTPLQNNRFHLFALAVGYTLFGALFFFTEDRTMARKVAEFIPFAAVGILSVSLGLILRCHPWIARRSNAIVFTTMVIATAQYSWFAGQNGFAGPYFAWALAGPTGCLIALATFRKYSVVVTFAWIAFGLNVVSAAYFRVGTVFFYLSHAHLLIMVVPVMSNIVRVAQRARQHRNEALFLRAQSRLTQRIKQENPVDRGGHPL